MKYFTMQKSGKIQKKIFFGGRGANGKMSLRYFGEEIFMRSLK